MKIKNNLTLSEIETYFEVIDNVLFWKKEVRGKNRTNKPILGSVHSKYIQVELNRKVYSVHRILYQIYNRLDILPYCEIDHIDGDSKNNSPDNLRLCTVSENNCNTKLRKNNKTNIKGIYNYSKNKIVAQISKNKQEFKKHFNNSDLELAKEWLNNKRIELHGEFANFGDECTGTHSQINNTPVKQ